MLLQVTYLLRTIFQDRILIHTQIGLVRAPVATTFLQISSRIILVWVIINPFPYLAKSAWYSSMLIAWSIIEVIRYSYFVCTLSGYNPDLLTWLRYSMFYVLYPMGITSEYMNIWNAVKPAARKRQEFAWALQLLMFIYWPCKFKHGWEKEVLIDGSVVRHVYAYDGSEEEGA